ncbi:DUF2785 domain-containing protein [Lysobacter enzymogenes]|uniref:DUF2785 domain-containing protein n=1 Tax=Lysobacter enzymogenes TaxID=69 RepID=UPI001A9769D7|nr:DUF2785 domain-containing protein [Lysobacter enzymogenes]QQP98586.1 DUF2785 domain-containing protein [Lysobacter enzymogenes]
MRPAPLLCAGLLAAFAFAAPAVAASASAEPASGEPASAELVPAGPASAKSASARSSPAEAAPAAKPAPCPPAGYDAASLAALKARRFALPDPAAQRALAQGLLACLSDPDPELRDGTAFEALSQWLRAGDFDAATLRGLRDALYARLDGADGDGFGKPFAALVLSEIARTDRIAPWMDARERAAMLERAAAYLESVRDYRGYEARAGWRHGVAHGADWLLQLSLNPALEPAQQQRIVVAIATQAVPASGHAYVFGEPERLARPLLSAAARAGWAEKRWQDFFAALGAKVGALDRSDYAGWLGRRHDLRAFLLQVHWLAGRSEDARVRALGAAAEAALKRLD